MFDVGATNGLVEFCGAAGFCRLAIFKTPLLGNLVAHHDPSLDASFSSATGVISTAEPNHLIDRDRASELRVRAGPIEVGIVTRRAGASDAISLGNKSRALAQQTAASRFKLVCNARPQYPAFADTAGRQQLEPKLYQTAAREGPIGRIIAAAGLEHGNEFAWLAPCASGNCKNQRGETGKPHDRQAASSAFLA